ncbi:MAG: tRNA (guanosine(46)-N7)-methyltransferase TrmB [Deltaproteobacteria bacterium]|jgi:tRNA (guanine-N7-)-methyltransferase|nr:tRNA (guanosine(46)-N7)-methyltransferase TrmB [Deltaproteobacteria bacterium]
MNQYKQKILEFQDNIFSFKDVQVGQEVVSRVIKSFPIICELCSGAGNHLIELAKHDKARLFIGFELRFKRVYRTIEKAKANNIANRVLVMNCPCELFNEFFPERSLDGVYINFPDPWAKTRQKKHRLLSQNFLAKLALRIKIGGFFSFKTDHMEYFESVLVLLNSIQDFKIIRETTDLYNSEYLAENIQTEFEAMFLRENSPICYVLANIIKAEG